MFQLSQLSKFSYLINFIRSYKTFAKIYITFQNLQYYLNEDMSNNNSLVQWLNFLQLSTLNTSQNFLTGLTLHQVLKKNLNSYDNQFIIPSGNNKILNWNNLIKSLAKINIAISTEDKSRILQGNTQTIQNLLIQVKNHFEVKKQQPFDLNNIDAKADPKQTKSLLQIFVLLLIKNLHINTKESIALLSNDSKYLAHVFAKGFKDQVTPIINLLKDFQTYLPKIQQFCINKQNQVFFMKALKPGLISKFRQVSQLTLQILVQFSSQTQYPFQTMKNHLISTLILQYRRHPGLIDNICNAIVILSKYSKNLLTVLISDMNKKEFLTFSFEILTMAQETNLLKQFYSLNKFDELQALALDNLNDNNNFQIALLILIKIIQTNPKLVFEDHKKLTKIVTNLEKLTPNKKQQNIAYINGLFSLFDIFYRENVLVTQILYKIIIFKYKHTFDEDQSAIYCHNFLSIIKDFPSFSASMKVMIADVLVQKIEHFNDCVFETDYYILLEVIKSLCQKQKSVKSEKLQRNLSVKKLDLANSKIGNNQNQIEKQGLDEEEGLKILNTLSQIFFENISNSVVLINTMNLIVETFDYSPLILQSTIRIVKVSLAIYFANIRKLSICKKNNKGSIKLDDSNVLIKRKNLEIQFFLRKLINQRNKIINSNAQALLCFSYVQANAKCPSESIGLGSVISILGNLPQILNKYQQDLKHMEKSRKLRKNSPKQQQEQKIAPSPQFYNKKIIPPGQSYSDYITKVSKVSNHALRGIQKFQKNFDQKKKKLLQEQQKKLQEQQRMEQIQKMCTNKVFQKGVRVDPRIQTLNKYLYEFDTKEAEIKKEAIYQLRSLHIFNPAEEETCDIEGLKYVLKKYNKVLRVFFSNYGGKLKVGPTGVIEQHTEKQFLLHLSNVWKLFRDYQLDQLITIKEAQYLVQKLNTIKRKGYNDTNLLDFEIFEDFIVQASFTIFTRPPKELLGYTIAGMVEETFYQFRMLAGENKIDVSLFDDQLSLVQQDQSIANLNLELKKNPDYILPEGYKKIIEKKVEYYHSVSLNVFDQSYNDVVDVLDEIFYENLHFHIIEPFSEMVTNSYAKCHLSKKKQAPEESKQKYFSLNVKKQLFKYSGYDRKIARQVAFCLSEIVDCVEHGRKLGVKNKLTQKQLEQEKKKMEEEQQRKRQKRDQQIKRMLQKQKQQKQAKRKQEEEQRIKQAKKSEEEKAKKKQYEQSLKKKVEQYQQKKQIDKKKQQQEKNKEKIKSLEGYDKKRKQYLKVAKEIQQKQALNKSIQKIDHLSKEHKPLLNKEHKPLLNKEDKPVFKQKSKALLRVKTNPLPLKEQKSVKTSVKKLQPAKTQKKSISKASSATQDLLTKKIGPISTKNSNKLTLAPNKAESLSNPTSK